MPQAFGAQSGTKKAAQNGKEQENPFIIDLRQEIQKIAAEFHYKIPKKYLPAIEAEILGLATDEKAKDRVFYSLFDFFGAVEKFISLPMFKEEMADPKNSQYALKNLMAGTLIYNSEEGSASIFNMLEHPSFKPDWLETANFMPTLNAIGKSKSLIDMVTADFAHNVAIKSREIYDRLISNISCQSLIALVSNANSSKEMLTILHVVDLAARKIDMDDACKLASPIASIVNTAMASIPADYDRSYENTMFLKLVGLLKSIVDVSGEESLRIFSELAAINDGDAIFLAAGASFACVNSGAGATNAEKIAKGIGNVANLAKASDKKSLFTDDDERLAGIFGGLKKGEFVDAAEIMLAASSSENAPKALDLICALSNRGIPKGVAANIDFSLPLEEQVFYARYAGAIKEYAPDALLPENLNMLKILSLLSRSSEFSADWLSSKEFLSAVQTLSKLPKGGGLTGGNGIYGSDLGVVIGEANLSKKEAMLILSKAASLDDPYVFLSAIRNLLQNENSPSSLKSGGKEAEKIISDVSKASLVVSSCQDPDERDFLASWLENRLEMVSSEKELSRIVIEMKKLLSEVNGISDKKLLSAFSNDLDPDHNGGFAWSLEFLRIIKHCEKKSMGEDQIRILADFFNGLSLREDFDPKWMALRGRASLVSEAERLLSGALDSESAQDGIRQSLEFIDKRDLKIFMVVAADYASKNQENLGKLDNALDKISDIYNDQLSQDQSEIDKPRNIVPQLGTPWLDRKSGMFEGFIDCVYAMNNDKEDYNFFTDDLLRLAAGRQLGSFFKDISGLKPGFIWRFTQSAIECPATATDQNLVRAAVETTKQLVSMDSNSLFSATFPTSLRNLTSKNPETTRILWSEVLKEPRLSFAMALSLNQLLTYSDKLDENFAKDPQGAINLAREISVKVMSTNPKTDKEYLTINLVLEQFLRSSDKLQESTIDKKFSIDSLPLIISFLNQSAQSPNQSENSKERDYTLSMALELAHNKFFETSWFDPKSEKYIGNIVLRLSGVCGDYFTDNEGKYRMPSGKIDSLHLQILLENLSFDEISRLDKGLFGNDRFKNQDATINLLAEAALQDDKHILHTLMQRGNLELVDSKSALLYEYIHAPLRSSIDFYPGAYDPEKLAIAIREINDDESGNTISEFLKCKSLDKKYMDPQSPLYVFNESTYGKNNDALYCLIKRDFMGGFFNNEWLDPKSPSYLLDKANNLIKACSGDAGWKFLIFGEVSDDASFKTVIDRVPKQQHPSQSVALVRSLAQRDDFDASVLLHDKFWQGIDCSQGASEMLDLLIKRDDFKISWLLKDDPANLSLSIIRMMDMLDNTKPNSKQEKAIAVYTTMEAIFPPENLNPFSEKQLPGWPEEKLREAISEYSRIGGALGWRGATLYLSVKDSELFQSKKDDSEKAALLVDMLQVFDKFGMDYYFRPGAEPLANAYLTAVDPSFSEGKRTALVILNKSDYNNAFAQDKPVYQSLIDPKYIFSAVPANDVGNQLAELVQNNTISQEGSDKILTAVASIGKAKATELTIDGIAYTLSKQDGKLTMRDKGGCLVISESDSEDNVKAQNDNAGTATAKDAFPHLSAKEFDVVLLGAHGEPSGMHFGSSNNEKSVIDVDDIDQGKGWHKGDWAFRLKKEGTVIIFSCSTASSKIDYLASTNVGNVTKTIGALYWSKDTRAHVYAPTVPVAVNSLIYDGGKVVGVNWEAEENKNPGMVLDIATGEFMQQKPPEATKTEKKSEKTI